MYKRKRCKRCDKRWCGTNGQMLKLYPDEPEMHHFITYGSRKCRDKALKKKAKKWKKLRKQREKIEKELLTSMLASTQKQERILKPLTTPTTA